jgi:transcriptional regulator GlxA family with amidase domain
VVAFATEGVSAFGVSVVANMFTDRTHLGLPQFEFAICAETAGTLRTDLGLLVEVEHGPEVMSTADVIILLPTDGRPLTLKPSIIHHITSAYRRGAIVAAYDTGSFLLAETGLLDGRRATTNWCLAERMAQRYPAISAVDAQALYVDEGRILTGAGAAAGIDMGLHLLRREHGTAVSNAVAREAMVAPRRESGQVQYLSTPSYQDSPKPPDGEDTRLADVLIWARARLQQPLSVNDLAKRALMSPRTFARRFRTATGTTPHAWLREQRLDRVEELLETTDLPIQKIAHQVGFHSDGVLRDHFIKRHGIPPRTYRHIFHRN